MTVAEFKKLKPEYADAEGEELWNAMTDFMTKQEQGAEILKAILPFWKRYTLRWLFYRRVPNMKFSHPSRDKYSSDKRCASCKWGVNARMAFIMMRKDGTSKSYSLCPHCAEEYKEEPNTNLSHRAYKVWSWLTGIFWTILDRLHLVRSSCNGRFSMFGDEARYIKGWYLDMGTGKTTPIHRKRKWWQYIVIEKIGSI